MSEHAILIAGPTASGKSALALSEAGAARREGRRPLIINADSMQVYRELRIVSARPDADDEAFAPHLLYGFVPAGELFSTGRWLEEMTRILAGLREEDLAIIVGGTGLYFKALTEGFAVIPEIPEEVRAPLRAALFEDGAGRMHRLLHMIDEAAARELRPSDSQRILRALEVKKATGKSILWWQTQAQAAPLLRARDCRKIVALPPRDVLYARIDARFDGMVAAGALDEVAALRALRLDAALPAMKAIGVPQFIAHLEEGMALDLAVEDAKRESRRYAKRQMTWLRNQMGGDWARIDTAV